MTASGLDLRVQPYKVASDTDVIPQLLEAPPIGLMYVNSLAITGAEPVLVDTGAPSNRQQWLQDAWNLVDPADVRWLFLTHDDHDHAGNLRQVTDACPNATLVTAWYSMGRYAIDSEDFWLPFDWPVDAFGANIPHPVTDAAELDRDAWREGVLLINRLNHPWHLWLDQAEFHSYVDHVQHLGIEAPASCHGPAIHGAMVDQAFELIRRIPQLAILSAVLAVAGVHLLPAAVRVTLAVTVPGGVDHNPPGGHD